MLMLLEKQVPVTVRTGRREIGHVVSVTRGGDWTQLESETSAEHIVDVEADLQMGFQNS